MNRTAAIAAILLSLAVTAGAQPVSGVPLVQQLRMDFDAANGGFGKGPKVVQPLVLEFLVRQAARGNRDARDIVIPTLLVMAKGGINDQVGGGFHHQSLDPAWRVPRFEKTLSDQALLAMAYTEAWQLTGDDTFRRVARRTLDYVLRDLAEKNSTFDAGQTAESLAPIGGGPKIVVGRFYGWELPELRRLLGSKTDLIVYYYGLKPDGNVPEDLDAAGELKGLNLLSAAHSDSDTRSKFGLKQEELQAALDAALARMQLVRSHRPQPQRDTRVGTFDNALMISALARAGVAFDDPHYKYVAGQAARFLETALYDAKSGNLAPAIVAGRASTAPPSVADYSSAVRAMMDVYEATFNPRWLKLAVTLQQTQDRRFWNGQALRYDTVPAQQTDSIVPAANSIAAENLLRLAAITGSSAWQTNAEAIFRSYGERIASSPGDLPALIAAGAARPVRVVVLIGNPATDEGKSLLRAACAGIDPPRFVLVSAGKGADDPLAGSVPMLRDMKPGETTAATVCEKQLCRTPTSDPQKLAAFINN